MQFWQLYIVLEYTCPEPVLDNGFFQPERDEYTLGDVVNFVCNKGFTLNGEKRLKCGLKGEWSDDFPICQRMCYINFSFASYLS